MAGSCDETAIAPAEPGGVEPARKLSRQVRRPAVHTSQGGGKGLNWTGVTSNRQLDELLQKGRTTLNKKQIGSIYDKAQVLINKQLDFIGVVAAGGFTGVRSTVKGYHVDAEGGIALQDLYVKTK